MKPYKVMPAYDGDKPVFVVRYFTPSPPCIESRWVPLKDLPGTFETVDAAQAAADKANASY